MNSIFLIVGIINSLKFFELQEGSSLFSPEYKITDKFIQKEPHYKEPSSFRTEVFGAISQDTFLFLIYCEISGEQKPFSSILKRDGGILFNYEDAVGILIDPLNSEKNFYYFALNSIGTKEDGQGSEISASVSSEWDGKWEGRVWQEEKGWFAEFKIPWTAVGYTGKNDTIGINFVKVSYSNREISYVFDTGMNLFRPSYFGEIVFSSSEKGEKLKKFEIAFHPYIAERYFRQSEPQWNTYIGGEIELNLYLYYKNRIIFTYKPDYAEIEPDVEQISIDKGVEVFYPEKRRFFLEGLHLFSWNLFYSRRITDIDYGAKSYGSLKKGEYNFFILKSATPGDSNIYSGIAFTQSFLRNFDISLTGIGKKGDKSYGVAGGTFAYKPTKEITIDITGWNVLSDTFKGKKGFYLSASSFYNTAKMNGYIDLSYQKPYSYPSTGFFGFSTPIGERTGSASFTLHFFPSKKVFKEWHPSLGFAFSVDSTGKQARKFGQIGQRFVFTENFTLKTGVSYSSYKIYSTDWKRENVFFNYRRGKQIQMSGYTNIGEINNSFFIYTSHSLGLFKNFYSFYSFFTHYRSKTQGEQNIGGANLKLNFLKNFIFRSFFQYIYPAKKWDLNLMLGFLRKPIIIYVAHNETRSSDFNLVDRNFAAKILYTFSF